MVEFWHKEFPPIDGSTIPQRCHRTLSSMAAPVLPLPPHGQKGDISHWKAPALCETATFHESLAA